jgi:Na+-transporting methylmalonyl-CoA/oxaloacetate decarboxylase beta subunit
MKKRIIGIAGVLGAIGLLTFAVSKYIKIHSNSIAMIDGEEGPTTVFYAGKLGNNTLEWMFIIGILALVISVVLLLWRSKKH